MVDQVKAKTEKVRMELELKENDRSEQKEMKSGTKEWVYLWTAAPKDSTGWKQAG
jgi:hypothetical protein